MAKTVVHVTTIEEWNAVLGVWFKQGHAWVSGEQEYFELLFEHGGRYLYLGNTITWGKQGQSKYIEYVDFMAQPQDATKMVKPLIPMDILYL